MFSFKNSRVRRPSDSVFMALKDASRRAQTPVNTRQRTWVLQHGLTEAAAEGGDRMMQEIEVPRAEEI